MLERSIAEAPPGLFPHFREGVDVVFKQGPALGGGAELTTMTDFRLCSPGASVSFVQARMGVAPGWGGARRLVELVGRRKALQLLLTSSKLGSEEGAELGYFDAVIAGDEAVSQAEQWLLGGIKLNILILKYRLISKCY